MVRAATIAALLSLLPLTAEGETSYLLLRNGNLLAGQVHRQAGRLRVETDGAAVWLETEQVAVEVPSPSQAYEWMRRQTPNPTAGDHFRLAEWAMQNKLYPEASRELLEARNKSPQDPRAASLEEQLKELAFPKKPQEPTAAPARKTPLAMSDAQLDRLPSGSLEQFSRHIQPLLVNNCTTSGCHSPGGGQKFQLNRDLLHGLADQRSTRANLAAVLAAIDKQAPRRSPLLTAIMDSHAGRKGPAFTGRQSELSNDLVTWVDLVALPEVRPDTRHAKNAAQQSSGAISRFREKKELDKILGKDQPRPAPKGFRDEFDPEIFNRMSK